MAPVSQSGNRSLNSSSDASATFFAPAADRNCDNQCAKRREEGHGQRPVNIDDHGFGQLFARYVSERSDSLSRIRDRVGMTTYFMLCCRGTP